jgi:hypothetical protein
VGSMHAGVRPAKVIAPNAGSTSTVRELLPGGRYLEPPDPGILD